MASVLERIFQHATERGDRVAIADVFESWTYRDLAIRAVDLANRLASRQVMTGDVVAVAVGAGVDDFAGILGVLWSGAAYLPFDPTQPRSHWLPMLQAARVKTIVASDNFASSFINLELSVESATPNSASDETTIIPPAVRGEEDLAYVIHTSGTTGRPKGVTINHGNLLYSTNARHEYYGEASRFLLLSPLTFDSSVAGVFWTLTSGGTLCLSKKSDTHIDVDQIPALIREHEVTDLLCIPSLWQGLLQATPAEHLNSLQRVIVAGEACPSGLPLLHHQCLPQTELFNEYGPTEASVWCSVSRLVWDGEITIGQPIPGSEILLLDEEHELVSDGVAGEIFVVSPGVSAGYLHDPELTKARFVTAPASANGSGRRGYLTGDLGARNEQGDLLFLGRKDQQVKVRGHRIEIGAIEAKLDEIQGIHEAVVVPFQRQIVAFAIGSDSLSVDDVRLQLSGALPDYMVPSRIRLLTEFPRTPHGKVDRAALVGQIESETIDRESAPLDLATQLAALCGEIIGYPVARTDRFLNAGGDSLSALEFVTAIEDQFGYRLSVAELFSSPDMIGLAKDLQDASTTHGLLVPLRPEGQGPPLILFPPGGGNFLGYLPLVRALRISNPIYALQTPPAESRQTVSQITTSLLDAVRATLPGPYLLAGWSFGGILAFEAAQQLVSAGEQVPHLMILDAGVVYALSVVRKLFPDRDVPTFLMGSMDLTDFLPKLRKHAVQAGVVPANANSEQADAILKTFVEHALATAEYRIESYTGKALLVEAEEAWCAERRRPRREWSGHCSNLEIERVPGDHVSMMQSPQVRKLARVIERTLRSKRLPQITRSVARPGSVLRAH